MLFASNARDPPGLLSIYHETTYSTWHETPRNNYVHFPRRFETRPQRWPPISTISIDPFSGSDSRHIVFQFTPSKRAITITPVRETRNQMEMCMYTLSPPRSPFIPTLLFSIQSIILCSLRKKVRSTVQKISSFEIIRFLPNRCIERNTCVVVTPLPLFRFSAVSLVGYGLSIALDD